MNYKKIMIIEDEEDILESFSELVTDFGYEVIKCKDGYAGLKALEESKDTVGLILLDLMMEGIDGLEVLRNIKTSPEKYGTASVIILTNMVSEKTVEECFSMGAQSYLIKTEIGSEDLEREIKKYIKE